MGERWLYVVRHAEATAEESDLTERGRRQAELLGERLRGVPLAAVWHGPLARAAGTARLAAGQLDGVPVRLAEEAGDYVPYVPTYDELPEGTAERLLGFVHQWTPDEHADGARLAQAALRRFTGPTDGQPRHELVVTHNFLAGWLVRDAMYAPSWRWLGLNHCNAALTVIRYASGRPPAVLIQNDMAHLPPALRWTGL